MGLNEMGKHLSTQTPEHTHSVHIYEELLKAVENLCVLFQYLRFN